MKLRIAETAALLVSLVLSASPAAAEDPGANQSYLNTRTIWQPDAAPRVTGGAPVSRLIYVNGCFTAPGCQITAGTFNDAINNVSTVPTRSTVISTFNQSQEVWDATIACLREVYGPYDVDIVTEDPSPMPHHEAILAGLPSEVGLPPEVGGIAPASCSPIDNAISFSFANAPGTDWITACWTVAQESAHSFGLDHVVECRDPMTYVPNCGQKFFRNELLRCGELEPRTCRCTGTSQNSHALLRGVFGDGTPPAAPEIEIVLPMANSTVTDSMRTVVLADDPRLVAKVELYINGWLYGEKDGNGYFNRDDPYVFEGLGSSLPDGIMDIEILAYNDLGSMSSATVTVIKGMPCTSADTCLGGQVCDNGRCMYPEPMGQLGETCERDMDCVSLLCPDSGSERYCSQQCLLGVQDQCPESFDCLPASNGGGLCWPVVVDTEGCCSVSRGHAPSPGKLTLFALVAVVINRRKPAARP